MKVPPKRKGNCRPPAHTTTVNSLNESPSEKEGKSTTGVMLLATIFASMKVPPKRKGNLALSLIHD